MVRSTLEPVTSRPGNLVRNAYHVANAAVVIALVELVLTTPALRIGTAAAGLAAAWGMEASRRRFPAVNAFLMSLFARVAHPDEAMKVNSATWYTTAIFLLALAAPLEAGVAGLAVLGVGDPAAAIVGGRFGRVRIANGRSLEGTVAFVAFGFVAAYAVLAIGHAGPVAARVAVALAAAIAGGLAELLVRRIDDNLVVPLVAAAAAAGARALWTVEGAG